MQPYTLVHKVVYSLIVFNGTATEIEFFSLFICFDVRMLKHIHVAIQ